MKPKNKETSGLRTWLEIDTKKVARNYRLFRSLLGPKTALMAVVKSNAYGHDIFQFSKLMAELGADWLGVDSIVEGEALRKTGIKIPILALGHTLPEKFSEAAKRKISLTISTLAGIKELKKYRVKFHLKIDTGMHRQGFLPEEVPQVLKILKQNKIAPENFEGVYTHFAAAKNPAFPSDTLKKLALFNGAVKQVKQACFAPLAHAAATSGAILFPDARLDMARIGIGLYGLWPSRETAAGFAKKLDLRPVLSWKTIISEIKNLPTGSRIGYNFTEALARPGRIAVCPIGYWHGYPRALSAVGSALVRGQRAKVLGRVSMDMIIIDVSKIKNVAVGDTATLLGQSGKAEITADELADLSGTTNYEAVTRLNPLIRRIYF